jgi:hypothetical protein
VEVPSSVLLSAIRKRLRSCGSVEEKRALCDQITQTIDLTGAQDVSESNSEEDEDGADEDGADEDGAGEDGENEDEAVEGGNNEAEKDSAVEPTGVGH